jgi:hypothetical protein
MDKLFGDLFISSKPGKTSPFKTEVSQDEKSKSKLANDDIEEIKQEIEKESHSESCLNCKEDQVKDVKDNRAKISMRKSIERQPMYINVLNLKTVKKDNSGL